MTRGSSPANNLGRERGFSLIELTVVVAVLAVLAVSVGLAAGRGDGRSAVAREAEAFERAFAAARESAILSRVPQGLALTAVGWRPERLDFGQGAWAEAGPERRWSGSAFFLPAAGRPERLATSRSPGPAIVFLPDGRATRFSLRLSAEGGAQSCVSDGYAALACEAP